MPVNFGSMPLNKAMLGASEMKKVYLGSKVLYDKVSSGTSRGSTLWDSDRSDSGFASSIANGGRDAGPTLWAGVAQPDLPGSTKVYYEIEQITEVASWPTDAHIGVIPQAATLSTSFRGVADVGGAVIRLADGGIRLNTGAGTSASDWSFGSGWPMGSGDYAMFAIDTEEALIWFGNSTSGWYGDPAAGSGGIAITNGAWRIYCRPKDGGVLRLNTSAAQFQGSVPAGFTALDR